MNRDYARFCLSLPRLALEGRRLQKEMLKQYYPRVAKIRGTFHGTPLILSKRFLARRLASDLLPRMFKRGPLREFAPTQPTCDFDCMKATGWKAMYPLSPALTDQEIFDNSVVLDTARRAMNYSVADLVKVRELQTVIYRLQSFN
jgi:hypothetical protein